LYVIFAIAVALFFDLFFDLFFGADKLSEFTGSNFMAPCFLWVTLSRIDVVLN